MRAVKKEILKLISTWVAKSDDNELVCHISRRMIVL